MINNLLAKSKVNGGSTLMDHTVAVVNLSNFVLEKIINCEILENSGVKYDDIKKNVIMSGMFHDIGKCFHEIQNKLNGRGSKSMMTDDGLEFVGKKPKKNEKEDITHNLFSWAYLMQNISVDDSVLSGVLNHHVVYDHLLEYTAIKLNSIIEESDSDVFEEFTDIMSKYVADRFGVIVEKKECDNPTKVGAFPVFYDMSKKDTRSFIKNSMYFIVRTILIYADRVISGNQRDIQKFIDNDQEFMNDIFEQSLNVSDMPKDIVNELKDVDGNFVYDKERLKSQNDLLNEIKDSNNCIVNANAGYGKTLVALRWIMMTKKRTLWVVPRNVIARNTFKSINKEIKKMGYENKISVGLILGREPYHEGVENCDIIVTNIDNFLSPMVKNSEAHTLINILNSNVVFDEYHEFLTEGAMFSAFLSVVFARVRFTNSKTLLMSATAERFDERYWNEPDYKFIDFIKPKDIFNGDMEVNIHYKEYNKVDELEHAERDSFIILDTVGHSQDCYRAVFGDDKSLIHSRYTVNDRNEIEHKMYMRHGKYSDVSKRNTIVGTNIIGVGLDISAKNIYDFIISPEDTIQRGCGRGGRFGEKEYENEINYYACTLISNKTLKEEVSKRYDTSLHDKWISILKEYNGKKITKKEIYRIYDKFYGDNKKEIHGYWDKCFNESCKDLIKLRPYPCRKRSNKKGKTKLSNNLGFRGVNNSIFVIARHKDGTWSEPITLNKVLVNDDEIDRYVAKKQRYNYLCDKVEGFKYVCNEWHNLDAATQMKYALDEETPLLLYYAIYDKEYGLILNANNPSKVQDDSDLD